MAPIQITITQTGAQGSQGAQLTAGGQAYTAPSNMLGIGYYNPDVATALGLLVGATVGTFAVVNQQGTTPAVTQPFYGAQGTLGLANGQAVVLKNATPYTVLFIVGSANASASTPLPAILNPGGSVSFTYTSAANASSPIAISGSAATATSPQPSSAPPSLSPVTPGPIPLVPQSKKGWSTAAKVGAIIAVVGAVLVLFVIAGIIAQRKEMSQ